MYDAIVVGARCAGSPTAMLLARAGHDVLLVDRAGFPSDTLSTHYIHQPGVACLKRWGVLPAVVATGAPPIRRYTLDVGPFALEGSPPPGDEGIGTAYSVRRTLLDRILVDAAADAGAEVREHFAVDGLTYDRGCVTGICGRTAGGASVTERARIVIGADGMRSLVARGTGAAVYDATPSLTCAYYTYWTGVEMDGVELYPRPGRMIVASPTNDGRVVTIVFWPHTEFHDVRADIEGHMMRALDLAPGLAARVAGGTRADRFRGTAELPSFHRVSHGPGWALVGDAGLRLDPILALGITDAFRDAELLAGAVDAGLSGHADLHDALAERQRRRDAMTAAGFANTVEFAHLRPPSAEMQDLFGALREDPEQRDRFFGTFAGTVPAQEFYAPENLARIGGTAVARAACAARRPARAGPRRYNPHRARSRDPMRLFDLTGKVAVVTGGTRGIGLMMARGLLEAGASVYVSSRKADAGEAAVRELSGLGRVASLPADLSSEAECVRLAEEVRARESRVSVLVNNAGANWAQPLAEFPASGWDKVLDLNLKAPFFLTRAFLPLLEAAASDDDPARVINVGSIDGLRVSGLPTYSYSSSKAGLHHLTRVLARELGPRRITVNAVAPGPFESRMMAVTLERLGDEIVAGTPLGRIGRPDDMAGVAVYLASRAGAYVTGAVVPVDGGISIPG